MRPSLLILVAVTLAACRPPELPRREVRYRLVFDLHGESRFVPGENFTDEAIRDALVARVARDSGCAPEAVEAPLQKHNGRDVPQAYPLRACGVAHVYLMVARLDVDTHQAGVELRDTRAFFVRLSDAAPSEMAAILAREVSSVRPRSYVTDYGGDFDFHGSDFDALVEVVKQRAILNVLGAKDLACPRGETVPTLLHWNHQTIAYAEGCGKRATYLYVPTTEAEQFKLSAVAPIQ